MTRPRRDVDLVPLAARGNKAAFEELFARYNDHIHRVAVMVGAGDYIDDAVQVVWLWLLTGRWRLTGRDVGVGLEAFLVTLTRYAVFSLRWRHPPFAPLPEAEDDTWIGTPLIPEPPTPETIALRHERRGRLRAALARLPRYLRRVAHARYLEERSGPDIAETLGLRPSTITTCFAKLRVRLHHELSPVYPDLPPPRSGRHGSRHRITRAARLARAGHVHRARRRCR